MYLETWGGDSDACSFSCYAPFSPDDQRFSTDRLNNIARGKGNELWWWCDHGGEGDCSQQEHSGHLYTTTNDQGFYRIEFIRVGTYNILIEQPGFQRFEKTDILVETNRVVRSDAQLSVGQEQKVG